MITTARPQISLIIPVYNENGNLIPLLKRLVKALHAKRERYELVFVDDSSTDGSFETLQEASRDVSITVLRKRGRKGKATSILEGADHARADVLGFIDADLQYPPEAIPGMVETLREADIVVANRAIRNEGLLRSLLSRAYQYVFGVVFLGIRADIQSGLKVFKRDYLTSLQSEPSPWGLDYEMLYGAKRRGARIANFNIRFDGRSYGTSNVNVIRTGIELMWGALKLRKRYWRSDFLEWRRLRRSHEPQ